MKRLLLIVAMLLVGCGPQSGTIESKRMEPAHMYLQPVMIGKSMSLIPIHVPDRYFIRVSQTSNGKKRIGVVEVRKEAFDSLAVGQWYGVEK